MTTLAQVHCKCLFWLNFWLKFWKSVTNLVFFRILVKARTPILSKLLRKFKNNKISISMTLTRTSSIKNGSRTRKVTNNLFQVSRLRTEWKWTKLRAKYYLRHLLWRMHRLLDRGNFHSCLISIKRVKMDSSNSSSICQPHPLVTSRVILSQIRITRLRLNQVSRVVSHALASWPTTNNQATSISATKRPMPRARD